MRSDMIWVNDWNKYGGFIGAVKSNTSMKYKFEKCLLIENTKG